MTRRKPVSIEVVEEVGGRFVIFTYADGAVVQEVVDHTKKPTRKARRPRRKLKSLQDEWAGLHAGERLRAG